MGGVWHASLLVFTGNQVLFFLNTFILSFTIDNLRYVPWDCIVFVIEFRMKGISKMFVRRLPPPASCVETGHMTSTSSIETSRFSNLLIIDFINLRFYFLCIFDSELKTFFLHIGHALCRCVWPTPHQPSPGGGDPRHCRHDVSRSMIVPSRYSSTRVSESCDFTWENKEEIHKNEQLRWDHCSKRTFYGVHTIQSSRFQRNRRCAYDVTIFKSVIFVVGQGRG